MGGTIPVRQGEELNTENLLRFLHQAFPDLPREALEIEQFSAGHSNLTYLLKIGDWEAVLRRPPLGPVAPKAHDMKREYEWLTEIHPIFPLAPKPLFFSSDDSIIGSPFFLMERRKGIVLDAAFPPNIEPTPEICRKISETMVDTLVELHRLDYKKTKLVHMAQPDGFMERQVYGWIRRYEKAKTEDIQEVETLTKWLSEHIPSSCEATVIHYDYKLNNALFASDDISRIVGLFDWEMTTVGDPLADLAAAMSYWIQDNDPAILKFGLGNPPVTVYEGFYTRKEFIERYAHKSGRDVSNIHFYLTFAYFKLAVICQQIYYRYKRGQTNDERFKNFDQFVKSLVQYAWQLIEQ
ncbi:phosphotransferase family protein [Bacillus alveayuensis]|jgi:aminoglycoside phosphotransferase (APT) family kinase protein|uniref:phosphotransferase family protein n=1 Tax=Aeribacillus alveayuensis TaxID=279215 RepID=UPI0005D1022B|nr:phosphotransferase family protein [Bacillus alveayuensis]